MTDDEGEVLREQPLRTLTALQRAFEARVSTADLKAPVPGCGEWSVQELAAHLGTVHVWAAGKVLGEALQVPDPAGLPGADAQSRSAAVRYGRAAELLRLTLESVPIDQPCQTLAGVGPASFWHRRQTHETLIHLWDLCQALGSPMPPVESTIWEDCVAEVVEVMHPRQIRLGRTTTSPDSLLLVAEDTVRQWHIPAESSAEPAAVITATASELALLLWGRRGLEGLTISGDLQAVAALFADALTP